ncbi:hypothetical protein H1215_12205, partial [Anoxybacillus sp. LAT_38]
GVCTRLHVRIYKIPNFAYGTNVHSCPSSQWLLPFISERAIEKFTLALNEERGFSKEITLFD